MTMKDNRPAAHTDNHTESINKDIEVHIDHQDRTTSHDNNHNNNLTPNNKQLNNNIPNINIHPFTKNFNVLDVDNMDTIREDVV
jgi:hypothetical protein